MGYEKGVVVSENGEGDETNCTRVPSQHVRQVLRHIPFAVINYLSGKGVG